MDSFQNANVLHWAIMALRTKVAQNDHKNRYYITLSTSLAALIILVLLVRDHTITGPELSTFRMFNNLPESWHVVVTAVSEIGLVFGVVAAAIAAWLRYFKLAWRLLLSVGVAYVAAVIVKMLVDHPRPQGMLQDLHVRAAETGAGFPSAHVTIATVALLTLFPYLPRRWRWIIALAGIGLVAGSRMYLGVHSPYDVLGGAALGVAIVSIIRVLPRTIKVLSRLD
jgi:membrane-associated phospholipid phosphatase